MSRGFTLLEVIVALLLLEVGVTGAVGTLAVASRMLANAERIERAVSDADGVLDSLAGVAVAESGARDLPGGWLEWAVEEGGNVMLRAWDSAGALQFEVHSAVPTP